jgi:alanyl-tRNA synthetase
MDSNAIRESFFDFFKSKDHVLVKSSSLLPDSSNLLFTNAGMNQFVPYFLGERTPIAKRIVNTQKCIRAGGKHNDLDDVGFDTYHHSFFEMLGNWSFGDFFKREIIEWAWELLVYVWHFPKERLYATVYNPAEGDPVQFDLVSYEAWKDIFVREGLSCDEHIQYGGKADNFWMMGDTGPCGPCSEIHMDLTPNGDSKGEFVNKGNVRCIELWNLVFMQFNAMSDGSFVELPKFNVDTGIGFERVVGIIAKTKNFTDFSQVPSNYDSDIFSDTFQAIEGMCKHKYRGSLPLSREKMSGEERIDFAFRAIADHIRSLTFAIADGIFPSNEGRGYVLRRILRRAVAFCSNLGLKVGSFAKLSQVIVQKMGGVFGELVENAEIVHKVIHNEEVSFNKTLNRGMGTLEDIIAKSKTNVISGSDAFLLYDTYGLPVDLTQLVARNNGCTVDLKSFETKMEKQRERARLAQKKSEICLVSDEAKKTIFIGYDIDNTQNVDCKILDILTDGTDVILDKTPFYAECGGQVCDVGTLEIGDMVFNVTSVTVDKNSQILHRIDRNIHQSFCETKVKATVNRCARMASARNHTATHILHWALRSVLGAHVRQAGSSVNPSRLRFDFNHFEAISCENLAVIERLVQDKILECADVSIFETEFDKKPSDCIANFGEKYGDIVRVVRVGEYSTELCGGCHVNNSAEICFFKITCENSISFGIRRIEAVTGEEAFALANANSAAIASLGKLFSCKSDKIFDRASTLLEKITRLESDLKIVRNSVVANAVTALVSKAKHIEDDFYELNETVSGFSAFEIRTMAISLSKMLPEHIIVLTGEDGAESNVVAMCSVKAASRGHDAGQIVRNICVKRGGNGGGNKNFATGRFCNR